MGTKHSGLDQHQLRSWKWVKGVPNSIKLFSPKSASSIVAGVDPATRRAVYARPCGGVVELCLLAAPTSGGVRELYTPDPVVLVYLNVVPSGSSRERVGSGS